MKGIYLLLIFFLNFVFKLLILFVTAVIEILSLYGLVVDELKPSLWSHFKKRAAVFLDRYLVIKSMIGKVIKSKKLSNFYPDSWKLENIIILRHLDKTPSTC